MIRGRIVVEFMFMNLVVMFLYHIAEAILGKDDEDFQRLATQTNEFAGALTNQFNELKKMAN